MLVTWLIKYRISFIVIVCILTFLMSDSCASNNRKEMILRDKPTEIRNINHIAISICTLMVLVSAFGLENFFRIIRGAFRDNYFPRDILEIEREAIIIFLLCLICLLFVWLGTKKRWLVI